MRRKYLPLSLSVSSHKHRDEGMCLLEAAAYLAGKTHNDHPTCVSPVLAEFGRNLNDRLFSEHLDELVPYAARLVGSRKPSLENTRAYLLSDWTTRSLLPRALTRLGATEQAREVRDLAPITDRASALAAKQCLQRIYESPELLARLPRYSRERAPLDNVLGLLGDLVQMTTTGLPIVDAQGYRQGVAGSAEYTAFLYTLAATDEREALRAETLCLLDSLLEMT